LQREFEPQHPEGRRYHFRLGRRDGSFWHGSRLFTEGIAMLVATELAIGDAAQRRKGDIAIAAPHRHKLVSMLGLAAAEYYAAKCLRGIGICAYDLGGMVVIALVRATSVGAGIFGVP
jgi:hypothetical protein